jgi:hypothetical protein
VRAASAVRAKAGAFRPSRGRYDPVVSLPSVQAVQYVAPTTLRVRLPVECADRVVRYHHGVFMDDPLEGISARWCGLLEVDGSGNAFNLCPGTASPLSAGSTYSLAH